MKRNFRLAGLCAGLLVVATLGGCAAVVVGGAVGTALVVTDRRTAGTQLEDQNIELKALTRVRESVGERGHVNTTSYNRLVLLTGEVPTEGEGSVEGIPNLKAEFTFRRDPAGAFVPVAAPQGTEVGFLLSLPVVSQHGSYTAMTGDKKVAAWGTYCPGVVGMARDENPDSANSQFFLMRYAYPSLDKRYTAFGRVISGLDVIRAIKTGEPVEAPQDVMRTVRVLADIPEAERPKVKVIDPKSPWFAGEVKRVRKLKGADFSVCDIELPVEITP